MTNANAESAGSARSSFVRELKRGFAVLATWIGVRIAEAPTSDAATAPAPDPAPELIQEPPPAPMPTPAPAKPTSTKETSMKNTEETSKRVASIAARVLRNKGACTQEEARIMAASLITQTANSGKRKKAKKAKG